MMNINSMEALEYLSRLVGGKTALFHLCKELGLKCSQATLYRWIANKDNVSQDVYDSIYDGIKNEKTLKAKEIHRELEELYMFLTELVKFGIIRNMMVVEGEATEQDVLITKNELKDMEEKFKMNVYKEEEKPELQPEPQPEPEPEPQPESLPTSSFSLEDMLGASSATFVEKEPVKEEEIKQESNMLDTIISQSNKPVQTNVHVTDPFEAELRAMPDEFNSEEARI